MRVLVVYVTKYGSTREIAERIGATLNESGLEAVVAPAGEVGHVGDYDAYVVGSAAYMFHWMKEGSEFVRRNAAVLRGKPVWLFTSGPLGTDEVDSEGNDVRAAATPPEIAEFTELLKAREHRVFFGAYDASRLSLLHRLAMTFSTPRIKKLMIEGDFRNWSEIEIWSKSIATSLRPESTRSQDDSKKLAATTAAVNAVVLPGAH